MFAVQDTETDCADFSVQGNRSDNCLFGGVAATCGHDEAMDLICGIFKGEQSIQPLRSNLGNDFCRMVQGTVMKSVKIHGFDFGDMFYLIAHLVQHGIKSGRQERGDLEYREYSNNGRFLRNI